MNVDVASEAGSVSSSLGGLPASSPSYLHPHHSTYSTISSIASPSSSNIPLFNTATATTPLSESASSQQLRSLYQQNIPQASQSTCSSSAPFYQRLPVKPKPFTTSSLIHSAVASALSVPLATSGFAPSHPSHPTTSHPPPPSSSHPQASTTSGGPNDSTHQLIQDILVRSVLRQMSHQESSVQAINWKRLHLSKGKLKASSRTSALLSGFAMVAMVEVQLCENQKHPIPFSLLIAFAICTTLLVSVHMLALMISTCILPNVEAVASMQGLIPISESPHEKLSHYVEIAWIFSTVFGILLFMIEVILLCWVKFWDVGGMDGKIIAVTATILLIPIVAVFIGFAVHFYRNIVAHQYERSAKGLEELQVMVSQLQGDQQSSQIDPSEIISTTANVAPTKSGGFDGSSVRFAAGAGPSESANVANVTSTAQTNLTFSTAPSQLPGDQSTSLLSSHHTFHDSSVIHT